jgi:hypothetical protein
VGRLNWNRVGKMILKDLQVSQGKRLWQLLRLGTQSSYSLFSDTFEW